MKGFERTGQKISPKKKKKQREKKKALKVLYSQTNWFTYSGIIITYRYTYTQDPELN